MRILSITVLLSAVLIAAPAAWADIDTSFACYQCHAKKEITPWIAKTWLESAHAKAGIKCQRCHGSHDAGFDSPDFIAHPGQDKCAECHPIRAKETTAGKHAGKAKCNSCHPEHTFSLAVARDPAICATCHVSEHATGFLRSKMYVIYRVQGADYSATCQTCHMPDGDHNVNETLATKELMLQVCNRCHSASFAGSVLISKEKEKFILHW